MTFHSDELGELAARALLWAGKWLTAGFFAAMGMRLWEVLR